MTCVYGIIATLFFKGTGLTTTAVWEVKGTVHPKIPKSIFPYLWCCLSIFCFCCQVLEISVLKMSAFPYNKISYHGTSWHSACGAQSSKKDKRKKELNSFQYADISITRQLTPKQYRWLNNTTGQRKNMCFYFGWSVSFISCVYCWRTSLFDLQR